MQDSARTKADLLNELEELRRRNAELEETNLRLKRAEGQLEECRKKLHAIADYTNDWENWVGPDGRLIWVSPAVERITGYSAEECLSMSDFPLPMVADAYKEKARAAFAGAMKGTSADRLDFRVRRKNGAMKWVSVSYQPIYDVSGNYLGHRSSIRDITSRKRAEETLQRERDLLQAVMNGARNVHLVYLDRKFNFVRVNEAYAATCGYRPEEMIGKNHFALYPDPENEAIFARVRDTGEPFEIRDKPFVFPDQPGRGVTYWDWTLTPVKVDGHVEGLVFSLHETTGRKRVEDVILERQKQFDALIKNLKSAVAFIDRGGNISIVNPAFLRLFGLGENETIRNINDRNWGEWQVYKPDGTLLHLDDHPVRRAAIRGEPVKDELVGVRSPSGNDLIWTLISAEPIFGPDGAVESTICTYHDITELKRAEESLRQSEERFHSAFDRAAVPTLLVGPDVRILHCNAAFCDMVGYAETELFGKSAYEITHPDDVADSKAVVGRVVSGEEDSCSLEKRYIRKDNRVVWGIMSTSAVRDEKGQLLYFVTHVQDITGRKRAEEALRRSRAELDAALESMSDAVFISDDKGTFVKFNEAFAKYYRFRSRDECYKTLAEYRDYIEVYLDDGRLAPLDMWTVPRALRGETVNDAEYMLRRKDTGEQWWGSYNFAPIRDKDGKIVGSVVTGRDITERKRMEEQLRRIHDDLELRIRERTRELEQTYRDLIEEMEQRNRLEEQLRQAHKMEAIGTLAGGIAHDFNNILAAIIGFTEMAIDDVPDRPLVQKNLEKVMTSATRARELVKQILAFSQKTSYERVPVALTPIVKETVQLLRASIPATIDVTLSATAASDTVIASPVEVQQVVMNLATNALLAMEDRRGSLEIALSDTGFEPDASALDGTLREYLQIMVRDTGVGMGPEVMKRVFEPFFTTREVGKGSGMGLAMVYGIVKDLGGTVAVESEPGSGSTFRVFLPKAEAEVAENTDETRLPRGEERVLFVDDEPMLLEWGRETLERLGYTVTAVPDGRQALEIFSADPSLFDLVITDEAMPGMPGSDLCAELLGIRNDIPIILYTGHSETVSPEKAREMGAREFLMKPVKRQELASAVRRVVDGDKGQ